eukprot:gene38596-47665_t
MTLAERVRYPDFHSRIMTAQEAAALIPAGANVGMSGFTGAGYPKAIPLALAKRIEAEHAAGKSFRINVWTGASTAPELDGALAKVDGIDMRLPFQSDPICREKINTGKMQFNDMHLSHVAQQVHLEVAVLGVDETGGVGHVFAVGAADGGHALAVAHHAGAARQAGHAAAPVKL